MTEQEILDCVRTLAMSTAHPAWPAFVEAMAECQYGWDAIVNAWVWFQDGFMKGRPVATSHEIRCGACAAVIAVEPTVEANGVADCEGCGAHLAWFIPFAAELTGGVIREDLTFLREVTVDMTIVLAEEATHDEHRPKRERLLKILLALTGPKS